MANPRPPHAAVWLESKPFSGYLDKVHNAMAHSLLELDIVAALRFFDEAVRESRYHATAVVAIAGEEMAIGLLADYFRQQGVTASVLPGPVTQGTPKGSRLDRWLRVSRDREVTYYQTEIKNWSAHAIGGKVLRVGATPAQLEAYKIERWNKQWDGHTFRQESVLKVLTPMKPPVVDARVEPMICFWEALHPTGGLEPLFSVQLDNQYFSRVWVFSMSAYLRCCLGSGATSLQLEMPDTTNRLTWLHKVFKSP